MIKKRSLLLTKRFIVLVFAFLCALTFVLVASFKVNAVSSDAYSILTNPGQNSDTEMNIMWHTDLDKNGTYLLYTKKSDTAWTDAKKVYPNLQKISTFVGIGTIDASGTSYTQDKEFLKCVVNLVDLDSDTEYMYKVGQDVMSAVHYFKTGGASEFKVCVIADYHSYIKLPNRLKYGMAMIDTVEAYKGGVDFIMDVGDVVAWGGSYNFWQVMYEEANFHDYMWAGVNGNHDNMDKTNSKNTNQFFASTHAVPMNGYPGEEGVCYYFKYSDALFFILDNEYMGAAKVPEVQAWAQEAIDNNPSKYIIFLEHYQWFNVLSGSSVHLERWQDFFDKNGVDLAIAANHHIYARSKNLYGGKVVENGQGTVYLQTSSSDNERGQGTYVTGNPDELSGASKFQKEVLDYYFTEGGQTVSGIALSFNDEGILIELLDRNGTLRDSALVKAKRETPALDEEAKEEIGKNIKLYQDENGTKVLTLPNELTGFASSYEVYDGQNQIAACNYKGASSRFIKLNLDNNKDYNLSINVKFKDGSVKTYNYSCKTVQNCNLIKNLRAVGKSLEWDVNDTAKIISKYNVYRNGILIGQAMANPYTIGSPKYGEVFKLEAVDANGKVLETLQVVYGTFGDINQDGKVDDSDVKEIQKYLVGNLEVTEDVITFLDVNKDNKVNVMDATYIKLAIAGMIPSYCNVYYKVQFYGANNEIKETLDVRSGSDAKPTYLQSYNYDVLTYINDYHNVTGDTEVYAIYYPKEEN